MTKKSEIQKLINKLFSTKGTFVVILVAFAIFGIYLSLGNKVKNSELSTSSDNEPLTVNATGLDLGDAVRNIGDVEEVIAKWVEANPEAIIQSVVSMQKKAAEEQQKNAQRNVSTKKEDLFNNSSDPVYSPMGYDVVMIEFFDYNCGYCKKAYSSVEQLIKEDKKVKIIFKELPILGASSTELSKVAIAVNMVDAKKYFKFHSALMKGSAKTKEDAIEIAKNLGIDIQKLRKKLTNQKSVIEEEIKLNQKLASSIGINGTPAFVIGEEVIPGAIGVDGLKDKISVQRNN